AEHRQEADLRARGRQPRTRGPAPGRVQPAHRGLSRRARGRGRRRDPRAARRLVGTYGEPFTLALGARFFIPTGQRDNYTGDGAVRLDGRLEIAVDLDIFTYAARAGVEYRNLDASLGGSPIGSQLLFGAAAGLRFFDHALVIGPEVYGATIISNGDAVFATRSTPLDGVL